MGNLYSDGVETNIATFHDNITNGDCANPTVPASVRSNLTTILGRTAAYKNRVVTWHEMMRDKEKFSARPQGLEGLSRRPRHPMASPQGGIRTSVA